jgi:hypothetical protein
MQAQPLSKAIYNKAKELGVNTISLAFSGGSDEGHLHVQIDIDNYRTHAQRFEHDFKNLVEDWAWEAYDYSGAGDGNDYGDNIIYDLKEGKVRTSEWFHVVKEEDGGTTKLKISEDKES